MEGWDSDKMRIAILIDEYVSGAAPILAVQEALHLKKLGYEADILVGTRFDTKSQADETGGEIPIKFLTDGYPVLARLMRFRFPFFSFFSPQHLLSAFLAPSVIREGDYRLIIAHGLFSGLICDRLKKVRKIPFFMIFWDPSSTILPKVYSRTPLSAFFPVIIPATEMVDKSIARKADRLILGSKFHREWFSKRGIKNIEVIYPGCFPAQNLPVSRGDFALAVDRWDAGSRPDILLEVLKRSGKKFPLKIVGNWHNEAMREDFSRKIAAYDLKDFVEVIGKISFEKLRGLYLTARCFVHPTLEAFGMAALEAASYGCPLIIPAGSGVTDLFVHGQHGFFPQDKNNVDEYLGFLERIMLDENLSVRMGQAAWETARINTWEHHALRLDELIKKFSVASCGAPSASLFSSRA